MADPGSWRSDRGLSGETDRAMTAVVGKTLEVALVVLFVGILTTTLHAGIAPAYERAAGEEVADRVLVAASEEIERATPPDRHGTERHGFELERRVDLPPRIASGSYSVIANGTTLRLDHPETGIEATTKLAIPASVTNVTGSWRSGAITVLVIEAGRDQKSANESGETTGITIRLVNR